MGDPGRREDPAYLGHLANDGATCAPPTTAALTMAAIVSAPTVAALTMAVATTVVTTMAVATVAVTTVVLLAVGLLTRCASPERVEEYRSEAAAAANAVPVWVEGCHLALQAIVSIAVVSIAIVSTAMVGGGRSPQR